MTILQPPFVKTHIIKFLQASFFFAKSCCLPRTRSGRPGRRGTRTIVAPGPALLHFLCVYGVYCCVCVCVCERDTVCVVCAKGSIWPFSKDHGVLCLRIMYIVQSLHKRTIIHNSYRSDTLLGIRARKAWLYNFWKRKQQLLGWLLDNPSIDHMHMLINYTN